MHSDIGQVHWGLLPVSKGNRTEQKNKALSCPKQLLHRTDTIDSIDIKIALETGTATHSSAVG